MIEPIFLSEQTLIDLHDDLLEAHGGLPGLRQELVDSIAAYPRQKFAYGDPTPGITELGAAYAFAANKFHAFTDGNKRVSLAAMEIFLIENGFELTSSDAETLDVILSLAAGEIGEEDMAAWVGSNSAKTSHEF